MKELRKVHMAPVSKSSLLSLMYGKILSYVYMGNKQQKLFKVIMLILLLSLHREANFAVTNLQRVT